MEHNLTTGSVAKNAAKFSLPFLLSYFLQTLYGMADLAVIGMFCPTASTTAVSVGSQIMHMLTVIHVGLAMGSTVLIARAVGAEDKKTAARVIGSTAVLFLILSLVLTGALLLLVRPIVALVSTPAEAVKGTAAYLTVCFCGIPFITAYNIICSIYRGAGDSKSPMIFVAVACGCNIVLDILLIGVFKMDSSGAALGTVLAQMLSVAFALVSLKKRGMGIPISREDFRPDRETLGGVLKIGVPVAVQDGLIQIAFLSITIFANRRGMNDAAAVGIVEKVIGILFLVPSSMLQTTSALSAQNIGAQKPERARQTLWICMAAAVGWGLFATLVMQLAAEPFVGLFRRDTEVVRLGGQYMRGYVMDCMLAGVHFCFSGYFCALGKSGVSFIHNLLSMMLVRIPFAWWASVTFESLFPMGLASTFGSMLSVAICAGVYFALGRRRKREAEA